MKNTIENKNKFFAQYYGQPIGTKYYSDNDQFHKYVIGKDGFNWSWINLKPLSQISNEDAIEVAKLAHQSEHNNWIIKRRDSDLKYGSIHIERKGKLNDVYHVGISYKYAEIFANHHFLKTKDDDAKSFKTNIGKIQVNALKPTPYIIIVDYLRSKGYALPYLGITVEEMINWGWIKLKQ